MLVITNGKKQKQEPRMDYDRLKRTDASTVKWTKN